MSGMRKPLSSVFIAAENREGRKSGVGQVAAPHQGKDDYVVSQELRAERRSREAAAKLEALRGFLAKTLVERARERAEGAREIEIDDLPEALRAGPPPDHADFELGRPSLLGALLPRFGHAHEDRSSPVERAFERARSEWQAAKDRQDQAVAALRQGRAEATAARERRRADLARLDLADLDRAIAQELSAMPLPFEMAGEPGVSVGPKGQATVVWRAPALDEMVPSASRYRFVKKEDEIAAVPIPEEKRGPLYRRALAQLALLACETTLSFAPEERVSRARVDLFAEGIDPATGRDARTDLISLKINRASLAKLDLTRIDPIPCVQRLGGWAATAVNGEKP